MASGSQCLNLGVPKEDGLGDPTKETGHAGRKPVRERGTLVHSKSYLWKQNRIEEDEVSFSYTETEERTKNEDVEIGALPSSHL